MGNVKSTQPPKTHKGRKKEGHGNGKEHRSMQKRTLQFCLSHSVDPDKDRRTASGNEKAANQNSRDFNKCHERARTTNPFIIFFLRLCNKKPKENVTVIARAAGKLWSRMTPEQRKKYVDLANAEKKRRQERKRKRKRFSARSR